MGRAIIVSQIYCVAIFLNKTKRKKKQNTKKNKNRRKLQQKKNNQKLKKQKERKNLKLKTKKYQTKIKWTGTKTRNSNDPHFISILLSVLF